MMAGLFGEPSNFLQMIPPLSWHCTVVKNICLKYVKWEFFWKNNKIEPIVHDNMNVIWTTAKILINTFIFFVQILLIIYPLWIDHFETIHFVFQFFLEGSHFVLLVTCCVSNFLPTIGHFYVWSFEPNMYYCAEKNCEQKYIIPKKIWAENPNI